MKKATPVSGRAPVKKQTAPARAAWYQNKWLLLSLTLLVTLVVYLPSLKNGWTNWDDNGYVIENDLVKTLDLKTHFTTFQVMGNYHPLTTWSLALDYSRYGLDAYGYHLTNLLIHLGSTMLLFWFLSMLFGNGLVAAFGALVFSIHPMHVESVAWVSERKDVLYVLFYFAALVSWLHYLNRKQASMYALSLLLFVLSLLSKGQAVTLPVVLVLIDWLRRRKWDIKAILEKTPFFLMSVAFGIVAVLAQRESKAIQDIPDYTFLHRLLFASYALFTYVWKFFVPVNLSAFYPYPIKGTIPVSYCVGLVATLLLIAAVVFLFRESRWMWFGLLVFGVNIALLLQLLPVGSAVVAERYTYLAYVGLIIALGYVLMNGLPVGEKGYKVPRNASLAVASAMLVFFAYQTNARIRVWHDSEKLWTNVLEQYAYAPNAHNNLGSYYQKNNEPALALHHFNVALSYQSDFPEALINRSDIYRVNGKLDSAIADCSHAIRLDPHYEGAYMNRGIARSIAGQYDSAYNDFDHVIAINPNNARAYGNRGNLNDMRGNYEQALADYNRALLLNPEYNEVYGNRARTLAHLHRYDEALADLDKAVADNPQNPEPYALRADVHNSLGRYREALEDVTTAQQLGKPINPAFVALLKQRLGE